MVINQGKQTGEFVLSEGNGSYSRDQIVIDASAAAMVTGTVLGKITASGKYKAYTPGASDGTQNAAAILYTPVPDKTTDQMAVAIMRLAEVQAAELTGLDTAARAQLATLGIIVR